MHSQSACVKTAQDGSVAWQGSVEGRDVQVGFSLALMQMAIGWTCFSIIFLSKEDSMFFFGTKYGMRYFIFLLLCSSSPTLSGALWSVTAVTWSSSLPGPWWTIHFDQCKLGVTRPYYLFSIGREWHWKHTSYLSSECNCFIKTMQSPLWLIFTHPLPTQ